MPIKAESRSSFSYCSISKLVLSVCVNLATLVLQTRVGDSLASFGVLRRGTLVSVRERETQFSTPHR